MNIDDKNLQEKYQTELWQYLRFNDNVVKVVFTFSPMYGQKMWITKIYLKDKDVYTDFGTTFWKRLKNAISKLKDLGLKNYK